MNAPRRSSDFRADGGMLFPTASAFFEALGPRQHDAHVQRHHQEQWLRLKRAEHDLRNANVRIACEEICAQVRARYGKDS